MVQGGGAASGSLPGHWSRLRGCTLGQLAILRGMKRLALLRDGIAYGMPKK